MRLTLLQPPPVSAGRSVLLPVQAGNITKTRPIYESCRLGSIGANSVTASSSQRGLLQSARVEVYSLQFRLVTSLRLDLSMSHVTLEVWRLTLLQPPLVSAGRNVLPPVQAGNITKIRPIYESCHLGSMGANSVTASSSQRG
ncbi:hypothetical protein J6590_007660 [Homalodisca vitripennis]|nr:hypothetical protein J6590_007660 [Homalodisca vitripennis]